MRDSGLVKKMALLGKLCASLEVGLFVAEAEQVTDDLMMEARVTRMEKFVLLLILWMAGTQVLSAPVDSKPFNYLSLCDKRNQPVFVYQSLWTDNAQASARLHEFWLDRDKDVLKAQWWIKGDKPVYLVGNVVSESDFYLCAYRPGQNQPLGVFLGVFEGASLKLKAADAKENSLFVFNSYPVLSQTRSYSVRQDHRTIEHQILGKIPKGRSFSCETSVSTFSIVAPELPKNLAMANAKLRELVRFVDLSKETASCEDTPAVPSIKALSVTRMFASDRYLSAKLDYSTLKGELGDLTGKTLNLDLKRNRVLLLKDLFNAAELKLITQEINRRAQQLQGKPADIGDVDMVAFSFNDQTLVVSYEYEVHMDIPIPLDVLFGPMRLGKRGPFAQMRPSLRPIGTRR